jgi:septum site-determining protein MinC
MTADALHPSPITFRECTLRAVVLTPQPPIANWLVQLDGSAGQDRDTFAGRAVLLDLSALRPTKVELKALLARLKKRNIRIMAVEDRPSFARTWKSASRECRLTGRSARGGPRR